ncbi:MAG: FtsX-like permease family protein [Promethearchaeota archaeon]
MSLTLPLRNVTRHKFRTYLIVAAISVSVGLEVGIAITIDSLYEDFIERHRGDIFTDITIHPKYNSTIEELKTLSGNVQSLKGVKRVSPVAIFKVAEIDSLENISNNIILYGLKAETHPDSAQLEEIGGETPLEPPNVIVSFSAAKELQVGGTINLPKSSQMNFQGVNTSIQGIMSDRVYFGNYIGFYFILIDLDYLISLFTTEKHLAFHLAVMVKDFIDLNNVAKDIQDFVGPDFEVHREKTISYFDILAIQSYQAAMNLIIMASIVIEFLFIANILAINIRDRAKEFGILKAIGSSNLQFFFFLGLELLFYGGIASFLGILLGIGFSFISVFILNFNYPRLRIFALTIKPNTILSAFITGVFITMVAGLYPIFKAISLPVVQNIHWKVRRKKTKSKIWVFFLIIGTVLIFSGLITTNFVGASRFLVFEIFSWHFFVVWSILLGIFLLEIGLLHFLPGVGMKFKIWSGLLARTIATRNIERESQKSTITIMVTALALSFILIIGITSAAIIASVPNYYKERYGRIQIIAETKDNVEVPVSFVKDLAMNNSDIKRAEFMQQQRTKIDSIDAVIFGVNPDSYKYFIEETMINPPEADIPVLLNSTENGAIISDILLARIGARIGENLKVQVTSTSAVNMTLKGITSGNPFLQDGLYLYISSDLFREYWSNKTAKWIVMDTSPESGSANIVASQLLGQYSELQTVNAIDHYAKVIESSLKVSVLFFQILIIYTFLLSALAQLLNILMTIFRMDREIGVMRAMGLSQSDVLSIFSAESILLGVTGVIFGVFNGYIGAELLEWYISFSIPIETNANIIFIIFWVAISLVITFVSSQITSRRSVNTVIANALHSDLSFQVKKKQVTWTDFEKFMDSHLEQKDERHF